MARTVKLLKNGADPVGAPDFTLPVSIVAQVIPELDVNIAAQSIPTLNINIASISQGITVTTTVSNMPSTFPLPSDQLSQLQQITIANIAAGLVFNVNISQVTAALNIANFPSTYPLPSSQVSTLQQITIQNVASGLYIPINIAQVSTALNISNFPSTYPLPDTQVSTLQQVTIQNIAAGLYIPINIAQATATVNTNANISGVVAGVYVPITIHSVDAGVVFDINITNVQSGVVFNVNITGTPTINVRTSGGANIVIDMLTQGAYTERQSTLANNGATATMTGSNSTYRRGKYFPRGCRGYINYVDIYCNNADSASHTFTVYFAVAPGMGPVFSVTISVGGSSGADWRTATVRRFWNYDSMFVYVRCDSDLYGNVGYDNGTPYDGYYSSDEVTWIIGNVRYWIRVSVTGETVGDLPVSGTVNTVEVPASSSKSSIDLTSVPAGGSVTLIDYYGCGTCVLIGFYSDSPYVYPWIQCDDVDALVSLGGFSLQPGTLNNFMLPVGTGPGVALTKYDTTTNKYGLVITVPLQFRRHFKLQAFNADTGNAHNARCDVVFNLIR